MNCKIQPLSHKVIIEQRPSMKKVGSIIMVESVNKQSDLEATEGTIVAMAEDCFDYIEESKRPKVGDVVHFPKYEGLGKCYSNNNYRILLDETIWGISSRFIQLDEDLING